jgi:hypothetical protein
VRRIYISNELVTGSEKITRQQSKGKSGNTSHSLRKTTVLSGIRVYLSHGKFRGIDYFRATSQSELFDLISVDPDKTSQISVSFINSVVWHNFTDEFKPSLSSDRSLTRFSIDPNRINISNLSDSPTFLIELSAPDINGSFLIQRFLSGHIWRGYLPEATIGQEIILGEQKHNQGMRSKKKNTL